LSDPHSHESQRDFVIEIQCEIEGAQGREGGQSAYEKKESRSEVGPSSGFDDFALDLFQYLRGFVRVNADGV